ncbi:MAG: hypothetical protein KDK99_15225, partial [Verrucomicrobiales bacterium]|nr:hypothetical protein [Verrucomicrobiales bacterium]
DSYNANPDSMAAGLRTLAEAPARRRIAVLGSMGELGQHSAEGHASVGRLAATLGLDALFTVGSGDAIRIQQAAAASGLADTQHFSDHSTCASHLAGVLQAGDLVLVKGSRTAAMERLFPLLNDA